jgi:copper chaperone NosL
MKHNIIITAVCVFFLSVLGIVFASTPGEEDIDRHRECVQCGMDRKAYGFSRMLVVYEDGSSAGLCSLHCAVIEMDAGKERGVKALYAADRNTRALIDAGQAIWTIGGKKRGVMTERPKWAFGTEAGAQAFIAVNGGKIISWEEALAAAREDARPKPR